MKLANLQAITKFLKIKMYRLNFKILKSIWINDIFYPLNFQMN